MKKVLLFATCAIALFASCQKTEINYEGQPQEIAVFAVNKTATKAPVENTTFPDTYNMQVAAYLAVGDGVTTGSNYFDGTTFSKPTGEGATTNWTGGKYWPVSAATLNFLAVAPQIPAATAAEGESAAASVVTTFGTVAATPAEGESATTSNYVEKSTTVVTNNSTQQYDVMYAVARANKGAGSAPSAVPMTFKHAYSWLDFKFKTGNTASSDNPTITINKITVNGVATDGTLTVTVTNHDKSDDTNNPLSTTASWTATPNTNGINVPTLTDEDDILSNSEALTTTSTPYYKGLLVVPASSCKMTSFVIDYTITVGTDSHTFTYTYAPDTEIEMEAGKKYTYEITMTLSEIEVNPTVTTWEEYDSNESTEGNQPINVNTNQPSEGE